MNDLQDFLTHLTVSGLKPITVKFYRYQVQGFLKRVTSLREASADDVLDYIGAKHLAPQTCRHRYVGLRRLYNWLLSEGCLLRSPMVGIKPPKLPDRLPINVMTQGETEKMLASRSDQPGHPEFREHLIMLLLYSCSLRRGEVVCLRVCDFDLSAKTLKVVSGKSRCERLVPVGGRCSRLLGKWLEQEQLKDKDLIFTNVYGKKLYPQSISDMVKNVREEAGIRTKATTHSFRRSSATHMLRNKAPMQAVQRLLGHRKISSTEPYTRLFSADIAKMHATHHPRCKQKNYRFEDIPLPRRLYGNFPFDPTCCNKGASRMGGKCNLYSTDKR